MKAIPKFNKVVLAVLMGLITLMYSKGYAQFSGGIGTKDNPYQITTVEELDSVRRYTSQSFILMNDLDFNGTVYDSAHGGWTPIINPDVSEGFKGSFNGKGYSIKNLYCSTTKEAGLFNKLIYGSIDSLKLENVKVTGGSNVGGLVGKAETGIISNCAVTGLVQGTYSVGGLVGNADMGSISNSSVTGSVKGINNVGGVVGLGYGLIINNCKAKVKTEGYSSVGGIIGVLVSNGKINNCSSSETVTGTGDVGGVCGQSNDYVEINYCNSTSDVVGDSSVGGIVGYNYWYSNVKQSYYTGAVSGKNRVGGVAGKHHYSSLISDCYVTGNVSGGDRVGGIVGMSSCNISDLTFPNDAFIYRSYSVGEVKGGQYVGGLIGYNFGSQIIDSYVHGGISGDADVGSLVGGYFGSVTMTDCSREYESAMKQQATFDGWDFSTVWKISENNCFPALQSLDNAPFAFSDTLQIATNGSFIENDYEYESGLQNVTYKLLSTPQTGIVSDGVFSFNGSDTVGTKTDLKYRIGEVLAIGDTLWGNTVTASFEKIDSATSIDNSKLNNTYYEFMTLSSTTPLVKLKSPKSGTVILNVLKMNGQVIKTITKEVLANEVALVPLSKIPIGVYIIIMNVDGKQKGVAKFQKISGY